MCVHMCIGTVGVAGEWHHMAVVQYDREQDDRGEVHMSSLYNVMSHVHGCISHVHGCMYM